MSNRKKFGGLAVKKFSALVVKREKGNKKSEILRGLPL